jgi:hypothetical protein
MTQQIILNGTVPNDGTGDNLYVAANKINDNFTELYNRLGLTGSVTSIEVISYGPGGFNAGSSGTGSSTFGNTGSGSSEFGNSGSSGNSKFGNRGGGTGTSTFGNENGSPGSSEFGNGGSGNSGFGNTGGGASAFGNGGAGNSGFGNTGGGTSQFGNTGGGNANHGNIGSGNSGFGNSGSGTSGFGNSGSGTSGFGNSGSGDGTHGNIGGGNSRFGNSGNGNSTFGNSGTGTNTYITSEDPWQLLYSNGSKQIDSSQWLKVSTDASDSQGKSLHLAASTYDLGFGNSLKQHAIYFTDPTLGAPDLEFYPSKRMASIRYIDSGGGDLRGLFLSPNYNYNDTSFSGRGLGIYRYNDNGNRWTKTTINANEGSSGTHGVYIGRGAINFFQDIPSWAVPDQRADSLKGLAYIIIPGIHTEDGSMYVGQISANPYKNRDPDNSAKGIPYWSLGHKPSNQLIENQPAEGYEKSQRTPGTEVFVWTANNRIGINNTNPQFALDVTGSVNLTGQLLVDSSAGTEGKVLTSHGDSTSPTWETPANSGLAITSDSSGNVNYNLALTTASSGSITAAKVDNNKLKYNPSEKTGTLYTPNLVLSVPGTPLYETGYKEAYLYFRNPSGVNVSSINVYDDFYPNDPFVNNVSYFEVYTRNGSNESYGNLNFNGYGAFGFSDHFGDQGDTVVSYGRTGRAVMARLGTGTAQTTAQLPSAVTAGAGARGFVTDATSSTFYAVVNGGGSIGVPCFSDGVNWRIG